MISASDERSDRAKHGHEDDADAIPIIGIEAAKPQMTLTVNVEGGNGTVMKDL